MLILMMLGDEGANDCLVAAGCLPHVQTASAHFRAACSMSTRGIILCR